MKLFLISARLFKEIKGDKRTIAFFLIVPILIMTLIYFSLKEDESVRIGVISRGAARLFEGDVISALERNDDIILINLKIPDRESDPKLLKDKIHQQILKGNTDGVLYFDKQLLTDRFSDLPGKIHLFVKGTRPTITSIIYSSISDVMDDLGSSLPLVMDEDCSTECANSVNNLPIDLEEHYLYGSPDYEIIDMFLPIFPPLFVFFLTFVISTVIFQRERTGGTLQRLMVAPIGFAQIIWGYIGGFFIFASLQVVIVIAFILYLINIPFDLYQVISLFFICLITMVIALLSGLLASFLSANEFQAIQFVPLVILPQVFLSDLIWSVEQYPIFFRGLSKLFPLTHANYLTREIMIKSSSWNQLIPQLTMLLIFIPLILGVMLFISRRQFDPNHL